MVYKFAFKMKVFSVYDYRKESSMYLTGNQYKLEIVLVRVIFVLIFSIICGDFHVSSNVVLMNV